MDRVGPFDEVTLQPTYGSAAAAQLKNANPSSGEEGSIPPMEGMKHPIEELVYFIEQTLTALTGEDPDHTDLTQVYRGFLAKLNADLGDFVTKPMVRTYLPVYPEVLTATGKLGFADNGNGTITLAAAQGFVFRGVFGFSTDDWDAGERTLAHAADKTYHVVIRHNGGVPTLAIEDLAEAGYNPGALAEGDSGFDSDFDRILAARVVTDGANAPTITPLANKHRLATTAVHQDDSLLDGGENAARTEFDFQLNWARTPQAILVPREAGQPGAHERISDSVVDIDLLISDGIYEGMRIAPFGDRETSRYRVAGGMRCDAAVEIAVALHAFA